MPKVAIIATMKIAPGKRDEYLKHLAAHRRRCLENEPGTLSFEIVVPDKEPDTLLLYELYASPEAVTAHVNGDSMKQAKAEAGHLLASMTYFRGSQVE